MNAATTLNRSERQIGFGLAVALALLGLIMAAGAKQGVMAVHGTMAMMLGMYLVFYVGGSFYEPDPDVDRANQYYDAPTRFGVTMTLIWAIIGMSAGVWVAALMY